MAFSTTLKQFQQYLYWSSCYFVTSCILLSPFFCFFKKLWLVVLEFIRLQEQKYFRMTCNTSTCMCKLSFCRVACIGSLQSRAERKTQYTNASSTTNMNQHSLFQSHIPQPFWAQSTHPLPLRITILIPELELQWSLCVMSVTCDFLFFIPHSTVNLASHLSKWANPTPTGVIFCCISPSKFLSSHILPNKIMLDPLCTK